MLKAFNQSSPRPKLFFSDKPSNKSRLGLQRQIASRSFSARLSFAWVIEVEDFCHVTNLGNQTVGGSMKIMHYLL
jgi:hypothetical protein